MTVSHRPVGHDGARCGGKKHQGEGTCTQPAGWGTDHVGDGPCKLHGGSTRSVSKGATLRMVERQARVLFGRVSAEIKPVDNPLEAYAALAGRVTAWMETMDGLLDDMTEVGYSDERNGEQIYAAVQLYTQSMRDANAVLGSYARLRIDERLAAITEAKADMLKLALDSALAERGIVGPEAAAIKQATAKHLRIVHSA